MANEMVSFDGSFGKIRSCVRGDCKDSCSAVSVVPSEATGTEISSAVYRALHIHDERNG